jgi:hypothetical protein
MYYKIELPARKLANWARLEDENAHGVRLWSIACFFYGLAAIEEGERGPIAGPLAEVCGIIHEINTQHNNAGSLSPFLYELRHIARERLRVLIIDGWGTEVAAQVNP